MNEMTVGSVRKPEVLCSKTWGVRCTKKSCNSKLEDENKTF